jgi:hypothetical protein
MVSLKSERSRTHDVFIVISHKLGRARCGWRNLSHSLAIQWSVLHAPDGTRIVNIVNIKDFITNLCSKNVLNYD